MDRSHSTSTRLASAAAATALVLSLGFFAALVPGCNDAHGGGSGGNGSADVQAVVQNAAFLIEEGRDTFRHDTFGSEDFWGGALLLHQAILGSALGGVGDGIGPATALSLGLKVDSQAMGGDLRGAITSGHLDLADPANTVELLRRDAVVGLTGFFDGQGSLRSLGIQCALCHSTVDDSFQPGMGRPRDGWPNRDLDIGAIVASAPTLAPVASLLGITEEEVRAVLRTWGPGKFDAQLLLDGRAFRPDGLPGATLIPPALGLLGVNLHTSTGWGSIPYWNALVANLEMHGKGTFYDARLEDAGRFPIAAAAGFAEVESTEDRITPKLEGLHLYQLALPVPRPPNGSFDAEAAARGSTLFSGQAQCAECHVPPLYTEPGWNMHTAAEIGIDDFQASRSPDDRYRTTPLRAMFLRDRGGFYHDGRFADLPAVVEHYDAHFGLGLTDAQKLDLVEFLKSL